MKFLASLDKRRWVTAAAALTLAFLCGHVMQNVLSEKKPLATFQGVPDAAPKLKSNGEPRALPVPPAATLMPILDRPPVIRNRVVDEHEQRNEAKAGCGPTLVVSPAPAATVRVEVSAPCLPDTRVMLRQEDLVASGKTNSKGVMSLRMPAMSAEATIVIEIAGVRLSEPIEIREVVDFQYVAIQWKGPQSLRMHAYEFGARHSQFGHVWAGAPKSPSRASRGSGGFLTKLGDGVGPSAEIYSFPSGQSPLRGVVRLEVEVEVKDTNCGRTVHGVALQSGPMGSVRRTEIALKMPECDQVGEIVRLQNLLQDMRLAAR